MEHPVLVYPPLLRSVTKSEEQKEQLMELMQQVSDLESLKKRLISEKEEHVAFIHSLKEEAAMERER